MYEKGLKAGTHEGARPRNTPPKHAPGQVLQPLHTKDTTRQLNDETTRLGHGNYESEFAMSCG